MSKTNSAPTIGWTISSQIVRWIALLFLIITLLWILVIAQIRYGINRDCQDPYYRKLKLFGYWIEVNAGSLKDGCKQP